ncbi:MAG: DinB family protein [Anaerolineae bacterium]|nr:DinB family protein [Anaerolineae bacterium]
MNKGEIVTLIHFNFWANERILSTCERISTDEFTRPHTPDPGWGSLRGILAHTLDTEYGWRSVLQALDADNILDADDFDDVAALKSRWEIERAAWFDYLASLNDESLNLGYGDDPQNGSKVWQTILHVVTHGIQHRSEAAVLLTEYGQSPGELDFDLFLKEKPEFL